MIDLNRSLYLGIDPGNSGAMAILRDTGEYESHILLKETDRDVADWLYGYQDVIKHCVLEKVHAMPKQGVSSTFKFGTSFGFIIGLLTAYQISYDFVSPQKWMKYMDCKTGGDKNVTKYAAQRLFPGVKITHGNADALLIAEYVRRCFCDIGNIFRFDDILMDKNS